tara:strand:+ start:277 stop:504 length:228 start_codon:yes stop_codon:yes gene_type:complete
MYGINYWMKFLRELGFRELEMSGKIYNISTYKDLDTINDSVWALDIGQSVADQTIRNKWENNELFKKFSCIIYHK